MYRVRPEASVASMNEAGAPTGTGLTAPLATSTTWTVPLSVPPTRRCPSGLNTAPSAPGRRATTRGTERWRAPRTYVYPARCTVAGW